MKYLRGNCTPSQRLAYFVLYPKIINTFLKNNIISKLPKKLKNGIGILVGEAVLKLWIKTVILLMHNIIFQKDVDNFEIEHKTC